MEADRRVELLIGAVAVVAGLLLGVTPAGAEVIAAAGDVACRKGDAVTSDKCHHLATSDLVINTGASRVLVLGDLQYDSDLRSSSAGYADTWGRPAIKSITRPVIGNHESESDYYDYFNGSGVSSGPAGRRNEGWYSYDVGAWHLIAINSNCASGGQVSCAAGSPQEQWLRSDLAAHSNQCILAYWHHARFSSGHDGDNAFMQDIWRALYEAEADVVLSGHSHNYERFAPMDAAGNADGAKGIRGFVVGTGGAFFTGVSSARPNSVVRQNHTFGILELTLNTSSYSWRFVPEPGRTFTDTGSANCHKSPPGPGLDTQAPTTPQNLTANPAGSFQVNLAWNASSDNVGVTGYEIYRDGALLTTTTTRSYSDNAVIPGRTYSYQVRARDAAGNRSGYSNTATATPPIPDTQAPTAPQNLAAEATGPFNVNLTWNASTDNVGVTGYEIYRDGVFLATKTTTTHADTTVRPARTYSYQVRAIDAAGNRSAFSAPAAATPVDTQAPAAPQNLAANAANSSQVNLTWTAAIDDVGVTGYEIFRNGAFLASTAATSYTDTTVSFAVTNSYQVRALDGAANRSGFSNAAPVVITSKVSPEADAQVVQASAATNYGTSFLRTDGGSDPDIESYLRFTLSGASGAVQSARLRVHAYSGTSDGPAVYATETGWSESAITWTNRPAVTSGAIDDRAAIPSASWVEYNVAALVAGNGTYGFRLAQTSTDGVDFRSREYTDADLRPQLVVTTIQTAPPPPPPPPPGPGPAPPPPAAGGPPGSPLNPSGPFSPIGPDRIAPKLAVGGSAIQRLVRGGLAVTTRCDERCTVAAVVKLNIGRAGGLFRAHSAGRVLAAGEAAKLQVKFSSRAQRAIRRALSRGRRVLAKVTVRSSDATGNASSARQTIRLKR